MSAMRDVDVAALRGAVSRLLVEANDIDSWSTACLPSWRSTVLERTSMRPRGGGDEMSLPLDPA